MGERRTAVIIGTTVIVFIGLILGWALSSTEPTRTNLSEVSDPASINNQVQLSHVGIATGVNFAGQKVRVINGTLKNISARPLRRIEMKMVFLDYDGKSIQETLEKGFDVRQRPLEPNEQYRFETNFENLPANWNHRIPNIEIVRIAY